MNVVLSYANTLKQIFHALFHY